MAAPRKYSVELQQRATRMALDARRDPESARGAIKRVADQLGSTPRPCATGSVKPRSMAGFGPVPRPTMLSGWRSLNVRCVNCVGPTKS